MNIVCARNGILLNEIEWIGSGALQEADEEKKIIIKEKQTNKKKKNNNQKKHQNTVRAQQPTETTMNTQLHTQHWRRFGEVSND